MSDEPTTGVVAQPNRTVVMLLGAIVVLLVAIVVVVIMQPGDTAPAPVAGVPTGQAPSTGGAMPTGNYDPATAARVAEGKTPEEHVKAYFDAIVAGDYATAFALLPTDKREATTEADFAAQLQGYGINGYSMGATTEAAGDTIIQATANTPMGSFTYIWTFAQADGEWLVKSRELAGMGQ